MTLTVLTVAVIALFIGVLAIYLFMTGVLLNRIAGNLGDCLQNVRTIAGQASVIAPGITRINKSGGEIVGALPLLLDGAEGVAAKLAPSAAASATSSPTPEAPAAATPQAAPTGVGLLDTPETAPRGVGYLDV